MSLSRGKFSAWGVFQSLLEQLCSAYIEHLPVAAVTDRARVMGGVDEKALTFLSPGFLDQTQKSCYKGDGVLHPLLRVAWQDQKSSTKAKVATWFCHIAAFAPVESIAISF